MRRLFLALALGLAGASLSAQAVGTQLHSVDLVDFQHTKAQRFDDFIGRAVLLEFFAHW